MKEKFINIYYKLFKAVFHKDLHSISILDWWELTEGKLDKVLIKGKANEEQKFNAYLDLLQCYNREFGTSEEYKNMMKTKLRYAIALSQNLYKQNGESLMNLEIAKEDMLSFQPKEVQKEKQTLNDYLVFIEKNVKFEIKKEISAHKFYSYLKSIKNG